MSVGAPLLKRLGNFLVETTDDALGRALLVYAIALISGIIAFAANTVIELFSPKYASELLAMVIGLAFGIITFIEVQAVQQRRRKVLEDLRVVASLNHNVRNALQSIQYAAHLPTSSQNLHIINDSVRRIDETLRELFPAIDNAAGTEDRTTR